jgi:hypothetical protein
MQMRLLRPRLIVWFAIAALAMIACGPAQQQSQSGPAPEEAREIAKEAHLYGLPVVTNYQTMYKQAIDTDNPDYRAPFNVLPSAAGVATPDRR